MWYEIYLSLNYGYLFFYCGIFALIKTLTNQYINWFFKFIGFTQ